MQKGSPPSTGLKGKVGRSIFSKAGYGSKKDTHVANLWFAQTRRKYFYYYKLPRPNLYEAFIQTE